MFILLVVEVSRQLILSLMISHEVGVIRLFLVVDNHSLYVCEHVLSLSKTAIFHLAFLDALHSHSFFVLYIDRTAAIILLIATSTASSDILVHVRLHLLVTYGVRILLYDWPSVL